MRKNRKLPAVKSPVRPVMRFASVRSELVTDPKAGVPVVIATENPVQRYDDERSQVVSEVLLMDGISLRAGRTQIPIVDSHDDTTVRNVLGSVRNLRIEGDELVGDAFFAHDADSQNARQKLIDGHITDFSITAMPDESGFIPRGQTYKTTRGMVVEGPAVIVTRWTPHNASICSTGADERSAVRRSYEVLTERATNVDEALLGQLAGLGLPEGMTDPNQILAWVVGKMASAESADEPVENMESEESPTVEEKPVEAMAEETPAAESAPVEEQIENAVARAIKADVSRRKEIRALCEVHKIERAYADSLCDEGINLNIARERILKRMATNPIGQTTENARVTESEDDKFASAARDGILMRSARACGIRRNLYDGDKPAVGAQDFQNQSLFRIAETCLRRQGVAVERMVPKDIAMVAMGHTPTINRLRIQRSEGAYHTTGSFPNLLLDAANKTLLAGYEEAPYTWSMWARQAPAVADFKNINRIRFSESPDLEMVPENQPYPEGPMSDSKETYSVEKFGKIFSVTWETVVNDDLDAISRVPAMHGNAARRVQNKKVYEVLTSNPTMSDSNALFSSSHASGDNTSGGAGAPSVTTLNAAFVKMMTQKGLTSGVILNIQPRYLIVPVAYAATAMQLVGSIADPSVGGAAAGNSNTLNIYGPNGSRPLQVIAEPQLDAASATVWYLAADAGQIDTVELSFLQGEESPVLENEWDFDKDVYRYKIRQTFGVKAIDWRGLFRNSA